MRNINPILLRGVILIVCLLLLIGVGGIVTSDERPPIGQAPPINDTTTAEVVTQTQTQTNAPQTYAVTATSADAIDTQQLAEYGEIGTQADDRIELRMSPSDVTTVQNLSWVANVRPVIRSEPAQTDTETDIPGSSNGVSLGVQQAHQNGITGEDVEVGIIDSGFDTDSPAIASNVVETRSFRSSPGDPAHGTSVAEVVTRTAPDSQLSLVSSENGIDTEAAINYLKGQDVDIIVHSAGFPAFEDDGDHILTDEINAATGSGILFVNSAGNYAQTHWEGEFRDADGDDLHEWTQSGDERNCLPNCDREFSGDVTVYVRWTDQGAESHYRASLFNPETDEYISFDDDGVFTTASGTKYTVLSVNNIQSQPVDLTVDHISGPANDEIEVIVVEGPEEIQRKIPASSITAPADVPATVSVAAYEVGSRQLAPYSSRGPTDDGQTGIDVTGYTNIQVGNGLYGTEEFVFTGTSAAAPYIGGVAALVEDDQPGDQSPTELTSTLKSSSDDILDPGTDTASGSGVVNAADAVDVPETPPSVEVDVDPTDLSGDGTESNPYEISNASELQAMEDDLTANYQLVSNINASNTAQWNDQRGFDPVGEDPFNEGSSVAFSGSLDGNGFTITGLTIDRSTSAVGFSTGAVGLFGATDEEALLRDISLTGMTITGEENVGGVVGVNFGTIRAATASGDVTGSGEFNTGGLVGFAGNESLIQNATASVSVTGTNATGGVAGQNRGTIQTATASGDVSGSGRFNVGGLVGFANNQSDIQNVTASGDVDGPDLVGGLVGQNEGRITNAMASGNVNGFNLTGGLVGFSDGDGMIANATASGSVSGSDNVGGLVGQNNGTITTAMASGNAEGKSDIGGLVGANAGAVRNTIAFGTVSTGEFAGGLIGVHIGIVRDSVAIGDVIATTDAGGLIADRSRLGEQGTVRDSYWDKNATRQTTSAGNATGLSTAEMQGTGAAQNLALGFGETWQTVSGDYPELIALADSDTDSDSNSETDTDLVAEYAGEDDTVGPFDVITAIDDFRQQQLGPFQVLEIIQAFRN